MAAEAEYETTPARSAMALVIGAIAGAVLVSAFFMMGEFGQPVPSLAASIETGRFVFGYALAVWAAGLALIAPLPWLFLHRSRRRTWLMAAILGASLAFIAGFLGAGAFLIDLPQLIEGQFETRGLLASLWLAGLCGLSGAIVGVIVWRIAYYRAEPKAAFS